MRKLWKSIPFLSCFWFFLQFRNARNLCKIFFYISSFSLSFFWLIKIQVLRFLLQLAHWYMHTCTTTHTQKRYASGDTSVDMSLLSRLKWFSSLVWGYRQKCIQMIKGKEFFWMQISDGLSGKGHAHDDSERRFCGKE